MVRPHTSKGLSKVREGAIQGAFAFAPLAGFGAVLLLLLELPPLTALVVAGAVLLLGVVWGAVSAARKR